MKLRTIFLGCYLAMFLTVHAQEEMVCPEGTRRAAETVPEVSEAWCELDHDGTVVLHGPYRAWWPNGVLGTSGQYSFGKAVGEWTGWFPSGKIQGKQRFEEGEVVEARYWNEDGQPVPELIGPETSPSEH
jgi:hypothetical protein